MTLRGAIAAALTPLEEGGAGLDEDAVAPMIGFLAGAGLDGVLVAGTTGEGVLLALEERRRLAERVLAARPDGFAVAVHCGAQTTADTVSLSQHARSIGVDAVAVIAPPYFPLDADEVRDHLLAAARAADPVPFYVYEFRARSGYAIPVAVVARLRDAAPNVAGMKVSDTPWEEVEPYLATGLDVFVGSEPLALRGLAAGCAGAVSGLAAAFPDIVAALVHDRSEDAHAKVTLLRERLAGLPFHAALKAILGARGVPIGGSVRAPLRGLTAAEREAALAAAREVGVG
ncbi:MAG: dihydrodipicolinate synthase family protein [Actinomycetota bacterium]